VFLAIIAWNCLFGKYFALQLPHFWRDHRHAQMHLTFLAAQANRDPYFLKAVSRGSLSKSDRSHDSDGSICCHAANKQYLTEVSELEQPSGNSPVDHLKKSLLNWEQYAFIVWKIRHWSAVNCSRSSAWLNGGQAVIAAKRFYFCRQHFMMNFVSKSPRGEN